MLYPLVFQTVACLQEGDIQPLQLIQQRGYIFGCSHFPGATRRFAQQHTAALLIQLAEMAVYGIFHIAAFLH
ncbi:hypothetical protein D3C81_1988340 [compost metagenome]